MPMPPTNPSSWILYLPTTEGVRCGREGERESTMVVLPSAFPWGGEVGVESFSLGADKPVGSGLRLCVFIGSPSKDHNSPVFLVPGQGIGARQRSFPVGAKQVGGRRGQGSPPGCAADAGVDRSHAGISQDYLDAAAVRCLRHDRVTGGRIRPALEERSRADRVVAVAELVGEQRQPAKRGAGAC